MPTVTPVNGAHPFTEIVVDVPEGSVAPAELVNGPLRVGRTVGSCGAGQATAVTGLDGPPGGETMPGEPLLATTVTV
jgi:hypothetical protein